MVEEAQEPGLGAQEPHPLLQLAFVLGRDPPEQDEVAILGLAHRGVSPATLDDVRPVVTAEELRAARTDVDATSVTDEVAAYVVAVVRRTRDLPSVTLGGIFPQRFNPVLGDSYDNIARYGLSFQRSQNSGSSAPSGTRFMTIDALVPPVRMLSLRGEGAGGDQDLGSRRDDGLGRSGRRG